MRHEVKIEQVYLCRILNTQKPFEVRNNDRDYQVGDTLRFMPLESDTCDVFASFPGPFNDFQITYVDSGLGMVAGYVVLGLKEIPRGSDHE